MSKGKIQILSYSEVKKQLDYFGNALDSIIDHPEPDFRQISVAYEILDDMIKLTKRFLKYSNNHVQRLELLLESQIGYNRIHTILSEKANNFWQSEFYNLAERIGLRDD